MSINNLRVLIIDRHFAVGRGLKALIEEIPGLRVVGLATRGEHGLAQAAELLPDVVLVDAELPGLCSAAIIRLLLSRNRAASAAVSVKSTSSSQSLNQCPLIIRPISNPSLNRQSPNRQCWIQLRALPQ